jgi:hypothetical protein
LFDLTIKNSEDTKGAEINPAPKNIYKSFADRFIIEHEISIGYKDLYCIYVFCQFWGIEKSF